MKEFVKAFQDSGPDQQVIYVNVDAIVYIGTNKYDKEEDESRPAYLHIEDPDRGMRSLEAELRIGDLFRALGAKIVGELADWEKPRVGFE